MDADTIRRRTHAQAATRTRAEREQLPTAFAEAAGDPEAHIDAGMCEALHESAGGAAEIGSARNDPAGHRDRPAGAARRGAAATGAGDRPRDGGGDDRPAVEADRGAVAGRWCGAARRTALSDTPEWAEYWNPLAA